MHEMSPISRTDQWRRVTFKVVQQDAVRQPPTSCLPTWLILAFCVISFLVPLILAIFWIAAH